METTCTTSHQSSSGSLEDLKVPKAGQDVIVIGGGMAGLTAVEVLIGSIFGERRDIDEQRTRAEDARFNQVSHVSLLAGGNSLAFSPVQGPFGSFLTVAGSDDIRRDSQHEGFSRKIEAMFKYLKFDFRRNCFAERIKRTPNNSFRVTAIKDGAVHELEANKLILAIGHSLKDTPSELRQHVIRGTGELCMRLDSFLSSSTDMKECMDNLLAELRPTSDGKIRIALVGLGATLVEAVKIFQSLLNQPECKGGWFAPRPGIANVEFVLYDPQVALGTEGHPDLLSYIRRYQRSVQGTGSPASILTTESIDAYKQAVERRIEVFTDSRQLRIVPARFSWDEISVRNGLVNLPNDRGLTSEFSLVLDCSPFRRGVNATQKTLLEGTDAFRFKRLDAETWEAELKNECDRNQIGLMGAAFAPKHEWGMDPIYQQAYRSMQVLFPKKGK